MTPRRIVPVADAESSLRRRCVIEDSADAQYVLATVLMRERRFEEAISLCDAGATRWPKDPRFLFCLGQCYSGQGNPAEAEIRFRRILNNDPEQAIAWIQLGTALRAQDRHTEALEAFERATSIALKVDGPSDAFVELATEYQLVGQNERAAAVLESSLARYPSAEGYRAYAEVLLAMGRLREGWHHHEARWLVEPLLSARPGPIRPLWNGQDLSGKVILLFIEQGFGDVIMALRYAPSLSALGAKVLLGRFSDVAYGFAGIDQVIEEKASPPHFDYHVPVMSLPRVFGTELSSIPDEVPYLRPDPVRIQKWRRRLGSDGVVQVGLAWAGRPSHPWDKYRSMALTTLAPLWGVEGVRFVSLQKGTGSEQIAKSESSQPLMNLGPELDDFADTAAVVSQLDLVICVDTSVAHLAGSLGKPVWVMLAQPSDWRWLEGREDTPWYPTMRLFRQKKCGEWPEVIERVRAALAQRIGESEIRNATPVTHLAERTPLRPKQTLARLSPGHKPGFSAVAGTRAGIVQYLPDEPIVGDSISWYGEYLQPQVDSLLPLLRSGATLIEVGAGVGIHALQLASAIGPAGHLFVYEPRPPQQNLLRQNLAANRVSNVTVVNQTLSAAAGRVGSGRVMIDELHLEHLHLLKIGDGGLASEVLSGGTDTLWRLRPLLFITSASGGFDKIIPTVKDFAYRCWKAETQLFNATNFNGRQDDIFSGGIASALLGIPEEIEAGLPFPGYVEL